jgi:hypothetical protein
MPSLGRRRLFAWIPDRLPVLMMLMPVYVSGALVCGAMYRDTLPPGPPKVQSGQSGPQRPDDGVAAAVAIALSEV